MFRKSAREARAPTAVRRSRIASPLAYLFVLSCFVTPPPKSLRATRIIKVRASLLLNTVDRSEEHGQRIPEPILEPKTTTRRVQETIRWVPPWSVGAILGLCFCIILIPRNGLIGTRSRRSLQQRVELEKRISELLNKAFALSTADFVGELRPEVERIMETIDVERMLLFLQITQFGNTRNISYVWQRSGDSLAERARPDLVIPPSIRTGLLHGEQFVIQDVGSMNEEMEAEREYFLQHDVRSCAGIPLRGNALVRGGLVCLTRRKARLWPEDLIRSLELIAGLLAEASREQVAEKMLYESESRFREMADGAPFMIWTTGVNNHYTYYNQSWLDFTGRPLEQALGAGPTESVHGDDVERYLETYGQSFERRQSFKMEYRLRRSDGEYHWVLDAGAPRFDPDGTFLGYIGSCVDIDESKRMQDALGSLSGRLMAAQEEERFRIARELHDDLSQRMALVLIRLEQVRQRYPEMPSHALAQLGEVAEIADEVSESIHQLYRELHPSRLEQLGLGPALSRLCREFSDQYGMQVDLIQHDVPKFIPRDIALCLYRVSQEALRNIWKHSGVKQASLELLGSADRVELRVSDPGKGFEVESADEKGGLGLLSMRERLRLVGGNLFVISQPTRGTEVRAEIALPTTAESGQETRPARSNEHLPYRGISQGNR
jgi:PAS domain S-box-containing protein